MNSAVFFVYAEEDFRLSKFPEKWWKRSTFYILNPLSYRFQNSELIILLSWPQERTIHVLLKRISDFWQAARMSKFTKKILIKMRWKFFPERAQLEKEGGGFEFPKFLKKKKEGGSDFFHKKRCDHNFDQVPIKSSWRSEYSMHIILSWCFG